MKLNCSRIGVVLAAVLLSVVVLPSLHAANFKIKPVVLTGDSAPGGGKFNFVGQFSMNNSGGMAFTGSSSSSQGIYFSMDGMITRLVKDGDAVLGEMALTGLVKTEEIVSGTNRGTIYTFDQSFSLSGNRMFCDKTITGIDPFHPVLLNESGDVVFKTGSRFFQESTNVVRLSGGTLTNLHCPAISYIIGVQLSEEHFVRVHDANASFLSNAGTVFLGLFTTETISRGSFNFRNFLVTGATATHVSDAEAVININDSGDLLRGTSQGFFFNSTPIALIGGQAGPGKTFRNFFGAPDLNNAGEVVFAAFLSDFSRAIFHWANGVLTPLVRQFDPAPGGRTFSNFFSVRLNDNGDVAFSAEAGPRSGVFLVSARGGLSKVVLPGDAAPGGGNFTVIGDHSFNNKGQIAFLGVLSTGKHGIFLASAGLETEFVDPVPDLLAGQAVTSDPTKLAKMGRVITGIAADGAARVVVRVKTGQAGTAEFSLVDESGASLPASNFNGSIGQVSETLGSGSVSVPSENVEGFGPMAFAAYHAPMDFSSSPTSIEAGDPDRKISIKVKLTTSTGETVESTESLKIVRPPVILVHGLWGSRVSWNVFEPVIRNKGFFVEPVDYSGTNAAGFHINGIRVLAKLPEVISKYKNKEQVAAVRADVATHSMGGLLVRMLPVFSSSFLRDDNFEKGDVHKLINIGTPNLGTPLARFLRRTPCVAQFFDKNKLPTDQGAIEDLVPNSRALNEINGLASGIQLHQIVGLVGEEDKLASENSLGFLYLQLIECPDDFKTFPSGTFFDTVLQTPDHDLIVPAASQRAGAGGNATIARDVIHTRINLFLVGIGELELRDIGDKIVRLLHSPLGQPDFASFIGSVGGP